MAELSPQTLENPALKGGSATGSAIATAMSSEIDLREIVKRVDANEKDIKLKDAVYNLDIKNEEKFQEVRDDIHNLDKKIDGNFHNLDKKIDANFNTLDKKIDNNFQEMKQFVVDLFNALDKKIDANAYEAKEAAAKLDKKIDDTVNKYIRQLYWIIIGGLFSLAGYVLFESGALKSIFTALFAS